MELGRLLTWLYSRPLKFYWTAILGRDAAARWTAQLTVQPPVGSYTVPAYLTDTIQLGGLLALLYSRLSKFYWAAILDRDDAAWWTACLAVQPPVEVLLGHHT